MLADLFLDPFVDPEELDSIDEEVTGDPFVFVELLTG